jgi:hypothetical protein
MLAWEKTISKTQTGRNFYVCSGSATVTLVLWEVSPFLECFFSKSLSNWKRVKIYLGVLRFFRYCSCRRLHHCLSFKVIFSEQWTWTRKQRNEMKWLIWNNKSQTCQLILALKRIAAILVKEERIKKTSLYYFFL